MMRVGIIGAMEQEVTLLRSHLQNCQTLTVAGCEFYRGKLNGFDVVLTKSGIGKVAAAVATTMLIERFDPTLIINTGCAGGLASELNVGDVVIASETRFHDVDVTAFGYQLGQMAQQPASFPCDVHMVQQVRNLLRNQELATYHVGLVGTGDQFVCAPAMIDKIRERFPSMLAVEMEGAAIAQVCNQFDIPYLIVRAISDVAGKEQVQSFESFVDEASQLSAKVIMTLLPRL